MRKETLRLLKSGQFKFSKKLLLFWLAGSIGFEVCSSPKNWPENQLKHVSMFNLQVLSGLGPSTPDPSSPEYRGEGEILHVSLRLRRVSRDDWGGVSKVD